MSVVSLAADWLQPFFSFWVDATLSVVVGVLAMSGAVPRRARKPLLVVLRVAAVMLGLGLAAYLSVATVAMTDTGPADFVGYLGVVLTGTDFGAMIWVAACAWLVLMLAAFPGHATSRAADGLPSWALVLWCFCGVLLAWHVPPRGMQPTMGSSASPSWRIRYTSSRRVCGSVRPWYSLAC